ncbi:PREDICTED: uncharacterized protein LOC108378823 [Rhagoletis zephyria]|uniref:uncharacterized protein LOC108378823 n=1 Tax=Rhagoletis zephyria TaxID=28612 RepID=UPI0008119E49|nr:PREDICTED: uncharacterized protein LOC108378823 [Rhagoletis zephyria]
MSVPAYLKGIKSANPVAVFNSGVTDFRYPCPAYWVLSKAAEGQYLSKIFLLSLPLFLPGFAHHLVGMHSHLHAPDWRALSAVGNPAALARPGFPHGAPFFHHQHPAFQAHSIAGSLERHGLRSINDSHHHLTQLRQLSTVGAAHSTTSPEGSPTTTTHNLDGRPPLTTSPPLTTTNSDNDNNNNIDAGFESDSISVTGSPRKTSSLHEDDDGRSTSPPSNCGSASGGGGGGGGGAFTSLIQRNSTLRKNELFTGFASQFSPAASNFNPALAAQLFLQNPLLPQPSQWLYTQLYGNYSDFPWFRGASNAVGDGLAQPVPPGVPPAELSGTTSLTATDACTNGVNLVKRCVTLISHSPDVENANPNASPPVTSTRRSPSPVETIDLDDVSTTSRTELESGGFGPIRCRTPKSTDVWRPY